MMNKLTLKDVDNVLSHICRVVVDTLSRHEEFESYFDNSRSNPLQSGIRGDILCAILRAFVTKGCVGFDKYTWEEEQQLYRDRAKILVDMTSTKE